MHAIGRFRYGSLPVILAMSVGPILGNTLTADDLAAQEEVRRGIRLVLDQMEEAYWTGDTKLMLGILAEDAVLLPPDQEPIIGREALNERYTRLFAERRVKMSMGIDELRIADDWAVIVGSTKNPGDDEAATKFLMVFDRATDGSWKLSRLIWNDNPDD